MEPETDLTAVQRILLEYVEGSAEPTWIMLKEIPEAQSDRDTLEAALRELESLKLLRASREPAYDPDSQDPMQMDDWWSLTDLGLRRLGPPDV